MHKIAKNAPHIEHWYIIFNKKVQYRKIVLFFTSRDVKKRHLRLHPIISDTNISKGIHFETTTYIYEICINIRCVRLYFTKSKVLLIEISFENHNE